MSIPIKPGTIRVYGKNVTHYATLEMKLGNMATLKLDNGETHNFNLDTNYVITSTGETDALVLDDRDASWLEEPEVWAYPG